MDSVVGRVATGVVSALVIALIISGCASMGSNTAKQIVGSWQSDIGGFPLIVEYTDKTVKVVGYNEIPYRIEDGQLILAQKGSSPRAVSFPAENEMVQIDSVTGTAQKFTRIN